MAEPLVPLGEIVTTHGLDGWLKLKSFNRDGTSLTSGAAVILEKNGHRSVHDVEAISPHKNQFLIKFSDLNTIDEAAPFVGATLAISEAALEPLAPSQYYLYQVVGFSVFDMNGELIGRILSTMSTPGGELYVVQGANKEHLIPAVKEIIEKIDFTTRKIVINPPNGLLDL